MNETQAFQIITQALQIANQKGAFQLQDSAQVYQALAVLSKLFPEAQEEKGTEEKQPLKKEVVEMKPNRATRRASKKK